MHIDYAFKIKVCHTEVNPKKALIITADNGKWEFQASSCSNQTATKHFLPDIYAHTFNYPFTQMPPPLPFIWYNHNPKGQPELEKKQNEIQGSNYKSIRTFELIKSSAIYVDERCSVRSILSISSSQQYSQSLQWRLFTPAIKECISQRMMSSAI